MTIPPFTEDPQEARPYFRRLRDAEDKIAGPETARSRHGRALHGHVARLRSRDRRGFDLRASGNGNLRGKGKALTPEDGSHSSFLCVLRILRGRRFDDPNSRHPAELPSPSRSILAPGRMRSPANSAMPEALSDCPAARDAPTRPASNFSQTFEGAALLRYHSVRPDQPQKSDSSRWTVSGRGAHSDLES